MRLELVGGRYWDFSLYTTRNKTFIARADASKSGQLHRKRRLMKREAFSYIFNFCERTGFHKFDSMANPIRNTTLVYLDDSSDE